MAGYYIIGWRFGTWSDRAALCESWRQDYWKILQGNSSKGRTASTSRLPDMRDISEYFIFQQDSAPAKETVDLSSELKHQLSPRLTVQI